MAIVLKQIPALTKSDHHVRKAGITNLKIIDSSYIWTEPNSMRLRILLTLRAEINNGVSIEQRIKVEFNIRWRQCPDCTKESRQRIWQAIVQLRQKRENDPTKRGLLILELAIARNALLRKDILSVQTKRNGFDFYFASVNKAQNFTSYLGKAAPMKTHTTRAVVSEDVKNNTANVRTTIVCDMVPLCRDDLLIVQKGANKGVGNLSGRLCLVLKMSSVVHLVDASPARDSDMNSICADLHAESYWKGGEEKSYRTLLTSKRLVRFIVLDVEKCHDGGESGRNHTHVDEVNKLYRGSKNGVVVNKYALADVEVARESDFGVNDDTFQCVTHLGNLLQVGDVVLGYDLNSTVLANEIEDNAFNSSFVMPDIILVRKVKRVGGGGVSNESSRLDDEVGRNRPKAKSSASKKRERRMAKEELKQKKLLEASSRMGLDTDKDVYLDLDDFDDDGGGEAFSESALAKIEEQIEIDDELADDLDFVEMELAVGMQNLATLDETSSSTVEEASNTTS
jgi:nonsense-mediated mRNA decay protein 3